jgi:predicted O-methyltransferase YrrM
MLLLQDNYSYLSKLDEFKQLQAEIPGFFLEQSAALWDALLSFQNTHGIHGNMLEIGVYKGLSALMSSLHLKETEEFVLIDCTRHIEDAEVNLTPILGARGRYIQRSSYQVTVGSLGDLRSSFRWLHIDGEHTGRAVINDLELCEQLLSDDGVIVLDDFFNPIYPQLAEALFIFLHQNPFKLSMVLCGWNKAYLARPMFALNYRHFIRQKLADELHSREIHQFVITKTATLDESTAFGICDQRFVDRDYYGLDSDPDFLPV